MAINELTFAIVSDSFRRKARMVAPTLEEYVASLYNAGIGKNKIRNLLLGELGEQNIFAPIRKAFASIAEINLERTRQETRERLLRDVLPQSQQYSWVLDSAKEHCEDCLDRANREPMTWEEWELIGLPKAGTTQCNFRCGCELVAVKS